MRVTISSDTIPPHSPAPYFLHCHTVVDSLLIDRSYALLQRYILMVFNANIMKRVRHRTCAVYRVVLLSKGSIGSGVVELDLKWYSKTYMTDLT